MSFSRFSTARAGLHGSFPHARSRRIDSAGLNVEPHGAVHLHHRRRGLLTGQGSRVGGARRAAAGARLHASACASSTPISTSIRARCRPTSTARCSSPTTARRPISTSATTSASPDDPASRADNITTGRIYQDILDQGAARRLSRRHHPGDPARHQRHQGFHPRRQRRRRLRADGDRRHGRRHRKPAVPRSDPPVRQRTAAPPRGLRPPHADALHPERGRIEDQADPAFGQGTALHRHPARHPAVPHRPGNPEGRAAQALAVLQRARERRDRGARRRQHLCGAGGLFGRGLRQRSAARLRARSRQAARSRALAADQRAHPQSGRPGHHRHRRQVHRHEGRLQIADRGAVPRRHRQQGEGQSRLDRVRGVREGRPGAVPRTRQRHPGAGRLRPARRRRQDPRGAVRARAPRAVFRHLLRHADGGDRGGAKPAAASPRPTRRSSRRRPSRWSA